jgi:hypothetical protein
MVNHGMGYPARYFNESGQPAIDADQVNWDLYRATEIAYGHAGYLTGLGISSEEGDAYVHRYPLGSLERALVEYYMLQQLQFQYLSANASIILYEDGGQMVGLSQALIDDINFINAKLYIEYDNGLKLYVNHDQVDNWIVNLNGMSYDLPPNGWVASNSNLNFLEYSAIVNNNRVDYVKSGVYTFARSRTGDPQIIGNLATDGTVALKRDELTNLREIHMVNTSVVDYTQAPYGVISTSTKCNLNLAYIDSYKFWFSTYGSDTRTIDVTYKDAPSTWRDPDGNLPSPSSEVIKVWRVDSQGNPIDSIPWTSPTGKEIKISNIVSNATYVVLLEIEIPFDTGQPANPYPSIMGAHNGTINPNQTITVSKLYTYPCPGTGGHTEFAMIWNETIGGCAVAEWNGYVGDYHIISFNKTLTLEEGVIYNYTICTGSYPQIHHTDNLSTSAGFITCSEFMDANGKRYNNWIPAIRLE